MMPTLVVYEGDLNGSDANIGENFKRVKPSLVVQEETLLAVKPTLTIAKLWRSETKKNSVCWMLAGIGWHWVHVCGVVALNGIKWNCLRPKVALNGDVLGSVNCKNN